MSNEIHTCDTLVLTCIDFRFHEGLIEKVREELGIERFDLVALAGGTRNSEEEINFHKSELSRGRYLVRQRFPKLDTKAFLVYKEGSEVKLLQI